LCVDSKGNSFVAGYTTFYFGSAGPYYYGTVTKYDPNGSVLWTNQFQYGAYAEPLIQSTALDQSGNDYVLLNNGSGPYATPFSTFKFAGGTGQLLWQVGDPANALDSFGEGLALDGLGNVWVTGSEVFRYPSSQYGTYRLNTNGNYNLTNLFPAAAGMVSVATSIAIDAGNNVYVTGFSPCTNTGNDIVTIKYDHNGNMIWLERYNGAGSGDDEGKAIGVDAIGNVYVTGYDTTPAGGTEMVTIKYVPAATIQREGNGDILLQNQGEPGEMFDFQASTNLQNWLNLGTMSADTNGFVQFLDTNAPNLAHRFYLTLPQ
jgi:hypothetical protein